jgi:hypothetical protein
LLARKFSLGFAIASTSAVYLAAGALLIAAMFFVKRDAAAMRARMAQRLRITAAVP